MTACAECGFDYEELPVPEVGAALRGCGQAFRDALGETDGEAAATRPEPTVWSALEYACHLRDVLLVQRDRLVLAQVRERPELAPMSSEERVAICRYDAQPLTEVLEQLSMAAELWRAGVRRAGRGRPRPRARLQLPRAGAPDRRLDGRAHGARRGAPPGRRRPRARPGPRPGRGGARPRDGRGVSNA